MKSFCFNYLLKFNTTNTFGTFTGRNLKKFIPKVESFAIISQVSEINFSFSSPVSQESQNALTINILSDCRTRTDKSEKTVMTWTRIRLEFLVNIGI